MPTSAEEVWRYSPIDELDLGAYRPAVSRPPEVPRASLAPALAGLVSEGAPVFVVVDGWPLDAPALPEGVAVRTARRVEGPAGLMPDGAGEAPWPWSPEEAEADGTKAEAAAYLGRGDALSALHQAFSPDTVVIDVAAGAMVEQPIVVVQWSTGSDPAGAPATFPHTVVRLGRGAEARVIEVLAGAPEGGRGLVVPLSEMAVGEGAHLRLVSLQMLGNEVWHLGRLVSRVERDASLEAFTAGLGAAYDRLQTAVEVRGTGASSRLRSVYLGAGNQVHDIRTLQDHAAPSTVSDLLCKGAVADSARTVYSGLIRVRPGATRTDALQSNHNLVLGEHAHADSVPNLDIEENDVRCSHASSVGPVDEDQRYYLESRGIRPERAQRLIVLGFFDDIIERCPVREVRDRLRREVGSRLLPALEGGA